MKNCEFFQTKKLALDRKRIHVKQHMAQTSSHLRFVAVKRKQEVQSGQTFLGILVLLFCECVKRETCKTETVLDLLGRVRCERCGFWILLI